MGDYLSDLVTKNFGTAEIIQPRRPAHFEPTQTKGALEVQNEPPSLQTESFAEEHIIEPMAPVRPRHRREARLSEKDEVTSSRKDSDERIAQALLVSPPTTHSSKTKQNDARVTLTPKAIEATREPASQSSSVPNPSSSTLSTILTPTQSSPKSAENQEKSNSIIEHAPIQTHRESPAETGELKMPPTKNFGKPGKQDVEAHTPIIVKPRVEKLENRVKEAPIHQTIFSLPREQMSKRISERAEVIETPIINVTIGRVEIRAVASSAPSKEKYTKPPPTLSLDEYLRKRRTGGER